MTAIADENKPSETTFSARPFVKWVGGKRSILTELIPRLPSVYKTYHEPFLGGAALFFAVKPVKAYLSDINFHLVVTFQTVRDHVDALIEQLKDHAEKHDKEYFLKARKRLFVEKDPIKISAFFIYLNKTCFNGLYRVNQSGFFNVPIGDYKDPPILDEDNLRSCSDALKDAKIKQHSFEQLEPEKDNFYYLDPPYHETYSGYDGRGFGEKEHTALAGFCKEIDKTGAFFMLSNSDTPLIRSLYNGFHIEQVSASRSVSCKANQRGKEKELIIRNYKS